MADEQKIFVESEGSHSEASLKKSNDLLMLAIDGNTIASESQSVAADRILRFLARFEIQHEYKNILNFSDGHHSLYVKAEGELAWIKIEDENGDNALSGRCDTDALIAWLQAASDT